MVFARFWVVSDVVPHPEALFASSSIESSDVAE